MLEIDPGIVDADIRLTDVSLAPGYGLLNDATIHAIKLTAQTEGLFLDPVYTGKAMAGPVPLDSGKKNRRQDSFLAHRRRTRIIRLRERIAKYLRKRYRVGSGKNLAAGRR